MFQGKFLQKVKYRKKIYIFHSFCTFPDIPYTICEKNWKTFRKKFEKREENSKKVKKSLYDF